MKNKLILAWVSLTPALGMATQIDPNEIRWGSAIGTMEIMREGGARQYRLSAPEVQRNIIEQESTLKLRTASPLVDGLFAMAIDDAKLNAVNTISDKDFNNGNPIACPCWQTGEQWPYVWTRDIAYSVHLALSHLDTQRSLKSLLFKTSQQRHGDEDRYEIVQDTGSGGSWPISTDRIVWAIACNYGP